MRDCSATPRCGLRIEGETYLILVVGWLVALLVTWS